MARLAFAGPMIAASLVLSLVVTTHPAGAQQSNSNSRATTLTAQGVASVPSDHTPDAPLHLFGDWAGARTYLNNLGIDLN